MRAGPPAPISSSIIIAIESKWLTNCSVLLWRDVGDAIQFGKTLVKAYFRRKIRVTDVTIHPPFMAVAKKELGFTNIAVAVP